MEGKEQAGAVLDIDSKAWEKMFFDEKYTEHAGADFGMNLTETDPTGRRRGGCRWKCSTREWGWLALCTAMVES